MKLRKAACVLLTTAMCVSTLVGCGKEKEIASNEPAQEKTTASETTAPSETTEPSEGSSWKRDTTPITVDWFVAYDWYGKVFDPVNNMADKQLQTETGVTINIITGDTEKLNALIISGDIPDIVTFDAVAPQRLQMENAGIVLDLEELSQKYAPDLNVPQSMKDWYRNEDGKWYSTISYFYGEERCNDDFGGFLVTHNNNFVRTDLLEQIGMTMDDLKTKDGLYKALKAVKDQKITYDGMEVTPITGVNTRYWAQQFGIQLEDEKGNYLDERLQPEYLEALKYNNKFFTEGFFTTDEFTQDGAARDQKVASGQVFFAQDFLTVKQGRRSLYANDPKALFLYCGQIQGGDSGKPSYLVSSDAAGWTTTMISKNAEHPDRIISLFSYLSQESVILDEEYGFGCYDIVDGTVVKKPEAVAEYTKDFNAAYNKYNMNLGYMVDYTINQKYENTNVEDVMELDRIAQERDENVKVYDDKCFYDVSPLAGTDLAATEASIGEYWKTMEPQIIMAKSEAECEKLYQDTIKQMEVMGLKELNEYKNERFKKNKEKLGIEFAWPSLQK